MDFFVHDPFHGAVIRAFDAWPASRLETAITDSWKSFQNWRAVPISSRAQFLERVRIMLLSRTDELANTITTEMGKRLGEARAEVEKCASLISHFVENGEKYLAARNLQADGKKHEIRFEPMGPLLAIMPWNFPLWQAFRFGIPALMAGNTILLKPAPETPQSSLIVEEIFRQAAQELDLGENIFIVILAHVRDVEKIISSPHVRGVSLTGSSEAGKKVAEMAGRHLKKVVLELGGSDAFVVLPDARLDKVIPEAVRSRMVNGGQTCISAKRFFIPRQMKEQFIERLKRSFLDLKPGDPRQPETTLAPLFHSRGINGLEVLVNEAKQKGAVIHIGGEIMHSRPQFFLPTIISGVTPKMRLFHEEAFGPVAVIFEYDDLEQMMAMVNGTNYGLGGSVWGEDEKLCQKIAQQMECGSVFINGMVKSDPRVPFGGVKASGYGRELGELGILEFTNAKCYNIY